jgi:hypothetical protein
METLPLIIISFFLAEFLVAIWIGVATPFERVRTLFKDYAIGVVFYFFFWIPVFAICWSSSGLDWLYPTYNYGVPIVLVCLHTYTVILHFYLRNRAANSPSKSENQVQEG